MMKKAELILKKAALFERLALNGDKRDFLKAIAQTTANDFNDNFQQLIRATKQALAMVPRELQSSQEAMYASVLLQGEPDMDKVKTAIDSLTKIVPWMKSNPTGNSLVQRYNTVRASWTLPEGTPTATDQLVGAPASKANSAQSIDSLFNFYYAKLQEAKKSSDSATAQSYVSKMEKVVNKLDDMSAKIVTTNPKESTRLSTLADKGRFLAQAVRNQFGTQKVPAGIEEYMKTQ